MRLIKNTKNRLDNVIKLIANLINIDFPYKHSREALEVIKKDLEKNVATISKLNEKSNLGTIKAVCKDINTSITRIYPTLGFIARSTNNRNLFELHRPLLNLVKKALGDNSKLIISSDWKYTPYTYIFHSTHVLGDFVWFSIPASESSKAQTIPLSGHEFGHNIWNKENFHDYFKIHVKDKVISYIVNDIFDEFKQVFPIIEDENDVTGLFGESTWLPAYQYSLFQCEEVFCDLIGLLIFKESFLHANEYFQSPRISALRSNRYLNTVNRVEVMIKAANKFNININDDYLDNFEDCDIRIDQPTKIILEIADHVTISLVDEIIRVASATVNRYQLDEYSRDGVDRIITCFKYGVPINNKESLTDILNAAWEFFNNDYPEWNSNFPDLINDKTKCENMLSELVIKSIEITDILNRLD